MGDRIKSQADFGNTGRNFYRGPGFFDSDLCLFKDFHFTERMMFTLGANAFNIFNHPNFANPMEQHYLQRLRTDTEYRFTSQQPIR